MNDGSTDLADFVVDSGSGAGSMTVERFESGCEPVCTAGFFWDIHVTGSFAGDLTLYYGGLDLNGLAESALRLYHWDGESLEDMGGTVDTKEHTITVDDMTEADFSPFFLDTSPNLIAMGSFSALYRNDAVVLSWKTATEIDNAGFHIWRSDGKDGEYVRITETLVPAMGDEVTGAVYSYMDTSASGTGFFYELEDIDYGCTSTFHALTARYLNLEPGWNVLDGDDFAAWRRRSNSEISAAGESVSNRRPLESCETRDRIWYRDHESGICNRRESPGQPSRCFSRSGSSTFRRGWSQRPQCGIRESRS